MGCGCKKPAQQAAGARAARPKRVARNSSIARQTGYQPRTYVVLSIDESQDEGGETVAEEYTTLAEAQKRLRDLGPGWKIESRRH